MKRTLVTIAVAVSVLVAPQVVAQSDKTPLDTTVKLINDRRSTSFFSRMTVTVELPDISAAELSAVRVFIHKALDDTGKNLYEPGEEEPGFFPVQRGYGRPDPSKRASFDIGLLNPARDAVALKELSGEIDLYMPTRDPDAVVTIARARTTAGTAVDNEVLKGSGVQVTVVDPRERAAEKEEAVKARAKELKENGYDDEDIGWMVESFADSFFVPGDDVIAVRIVDPDGRVQDVELVDPSGEAVDAYPMREDDMTVLTSYGDPLGTEIGLRISLRTPKTISRHTFSIEEVKLP